MLRHIDKMNNGLAFLQITSDFKVEQNSAYIIDFYLIWCLSFILYNLVPVHAGHLMLVL